MGKDTKTKSELSNYKPQIDSNYLSTLAKSSWKVTDDSLNLPFPC